MKTYLLSLMIVLAPLSSPLREPQLELHKVYTYERAGDLNFVFVPEGEGFLVWDKSEPEVTLVNWRDGRSRRFMVKGLDGEKLQVSEHRRIVWIDFVPNTSFIFLTLDDELLRVNRDGWRAVESYGHAYVEVANDGFFIVVSRQDSGAKSGVATVIETRSWTSIRSIQIPGRSAVLTPDNKLIAVSDFVWLEHEKRCLLTFFDVETGALVRTTDFLAHGSECPDNASFFHPTDPKTLINDRFMKEILFWDTESGRVVRKIKEPYRLQEPAVSLDGRWLYGSVRERDPLMLRDFKIWELESGKVVYESPVYPNLARTRSDNDPVPGAFSPDSQLLAVHTRGRLTLYRLEHK